MGNSKRGSFLNKLFLGKEKSEDYARSTLPTNRWELFWDIFKGRFGKLVIVNLLMLLFFIPLILLLFYRQGLIASYGSLYPFAQSFGVGYSAPLSLTGYSENIIFSVNAITFLILPLVAIIAALGLSGGAYIIRNMVWTEGVFVANDFWKGIKENYKQILLISILYSVVFYVLILANSFADQAIVSGNYAWIFIILKVIAIILLAYFSLVALHMITLSVTYEYSFLQLLKNGMVISLGFIFQNIVFFAISAIPFILLFFSDVLFLIGILVVLIIGLSFSMLVWTDYCQYIFDGYINTKLVGAKRNRGIYEKVKKDNSTFEKYKLQQKVVKQYSKYSSRPIKPITDEEIKIEELPTSFSRSDIEKLNLSKQAMYDDNAKYLKEHGYSEKNKEAEQNSNVDLDMQKRIALARRELEKRDRERKNKRK